LKGGDARTKADMFFVNAKEREEKYERELKKNRVNQTKLQKLKEDEDKKKSKGILGFLGKVFSTIINGLKSIVGAILDLGKAILSAFKRVAEIIIDVIGKALSLALAPLKLLGGVIKDFFIDFFKPQNPKNQEDKPQLITKEGMRAANPLTRIFVRILEEICGLI
jgi:hypothetical protein